MLAFGLPVAATAIGSQALQYLDRFLLGFYRGPVEVGLYAANYSLADRAISLLFGSLFLAAHPIMVQAWSQGRRSEVGALLDRIRRLTIIGGVPFVMATAIAGPDLVGVALAAEYAQASAAVPIVAAGSLCWCLGILNHQTIELEKRTRAITAMVGGLAVFNLVLNMILIPRYGWLGAAVATLGGYCGYFTLSRIAAFRLAGMRWQFPWSTALNAGFSAAVSFGGATALCHVIHCERAGAVAVMAAAAIVYAMMMWRSGEFTKAVS
jgi:O-antigen/teichoic acid export membrane protein